MEECGFVLWHPTEGEKLFTAESLEDQLRQETNLAKDGWQDTPDFPEDEPETTGKADENLADADIAYNAFREDIVKSDVTKLYKIDGNLNRNRVKIGTSPITEAQLAAVEKVIGFAVNHDNHEKLLEKLQALSDAQNDTQETN